MYSLRKAYRGRARRKSAYSFEQKASVSAVPVTSFTVEGAKPVLQPGQSDHGPLKAILQTK